MQWPNDTRWRERSGRLRQAIRTFFIDRLGGRVLPSASASKATRSHLEPGNWAGRLAEEKDFLLSLVRGMETEFLATGDGLKSLMLQLKKIQKECQSLTELTLGQSQDSAVQFAFQLLKKVEDLLLAYDQYDDVFAVFSGLQRWLFQLPKRHDELMRVLLPLNFITLAFRIEASRHPAEVQQAFFTLATNVNRTVNEVRGALEWHFEELGASELIARSLIEQISGSIQQHRKEVKAALETSRNRLRALNEDLARAGAEATKLSHLNQTVTRHIHGMIMSQQCQDIARQKIDHVGEAMDEMRAHLDEKRPATPAADLESRQFVFRAAQIQLRQTQNVFDELNRAADSLKSDMRSLRTDTDAATEEAVKVGSNMLEAKLSELSQTSVGELLAMIKQAGQRMADILAAFEPLQAKFANCTRKPTEVANDVRLAALNAQVFAIHAPNGATLEVLAGRAGAISDEVIHQAKQMEAALHQTAETVSNLQRRLNDFQIQSRMKQQVLTDESALSHEKLSCLEATIPVLIGRITQEQGIFAQSVEKVLANVQFPVAVTEANLRSIGFFRDLVAWGGEGGSELIAESAASKRIDLLKANYTMESERHAHTAALQPGPALASATVSQPSIELFGEVESESPTAADSLADVALPRERSEDQPCPATLSVDGVVPPAPTHPLASEKITGREELGENVELF